MHRPPRLVPNYGKRPRGVLPKSSMSRVLLYDNVTQQHMLDVKMTILDNEQVKTGRQMDMHRNSFMVRRQQRQKQMEENALHVTHTPPVLTVTTNTGINGGAEKPPGTTTTLRVRRAWGEPPPWVVEEPQEAPVTAKSTGRPDKGWEGFLPPVMRPRQGASSSQGFTLPPPPSPVPTAQRGLHTSSLELQREVPDPLPPIPSPAPSARSDKVQLVHMDDSSGGLTRVMHTFKRRSSRGEGGAKARKRKTGRVGVAGWGKRTTEDERYRMLERKLVRLEPPNEGYLELSPSFHTPRQPMTFTRPSSLHSSLYRTASSLSQERVVIGSLLPYVFMDSLSDYD